MGPDLARAYCAAKTAVVEAGFLEEIKWQDSRRLEDCRTSDFLREYAWVVLCCGMRESVIRRKFDLFSACFWNWSSPTLIVATQDLCRTLALQVFNHRNKVDAIVAVANTFLVVDFEWFKRSLQANPLECLRRFPYIGPVTCYHLAKNIGVDVAKPDRHLVRIAKALGFCSPQELCAAIADVTGDAVRTIDVVLWRFATLDRAYLPQLRLAAGY